VAEERQEEVWEFVRKQVAQQRQAYIVYPIIEGAKDDQPELDFSQDDGTGGDAAAAAPVKAVRKTRKSSKPKLFELPEEPVPTKPDLRSATEMYDQLRNGALRELRVGLLHGRLDADEKDVIMRRFQRGEIDVLVATTVIEVGVDVPNATVMVVDHAERFGMAQLHQLRGRVGRGAAKSYCILMTGARVSPQAEERLAAMVRTQNGFELAELDLAMRGPGEFFGTRQAGLPGFRVANLVRDRDLLELAKREAARFASVPEESVTDAERKRVWDHLRQAWQRRYGLMEAG
jgi:ATP-dependent DNA helicase RecG